MRIKLLLISLIILIFILFIQIAQSGSNCGPYGCLEPFTTCINNECVSTIKPTPVPTPIPTPTQTPYPSDTALLAIQRIYCGEKVCIILVMPPTGHNLTNGAFKQVQP